jgi:hypothetical protein
MLVSNDLNHRLQARPTVGPITESARFQYFNQVVSERWPRPVRIPSMLDMSGDAGFLAEMFAGLGFRVSVAEDADHLSAPRRKFDAACCCDRLEYRDDWATLVGRLAPMIRAGGVLFYSVVGRPRPSRTALGRVREWFTAPGRDHTIMANDLTAALAQAGFRVREVVGLEPCRGERPQDGPISYLGYAFRLSDRVRPARGEGRLRLTGLREWSALPRQARGWSIRVQQPII